jgi:5-methylcytosine-specific restriction enzyme A
MQTLKPTLILYKPSLGYGDPPSRGKERYRLDPWQKWYSSRKWKRLREMVLLRDHYTCNACGLIDPRPGQLICDHVVPHKGDEQKFWAGPFQTLCKTCHDGAKQRLERYTRR